MVKVEELNQQGLSTFYECFKDLMHEGYNSFSPRLQQHFLQYDYSYQHFELCLLRNIRKIYVIQDVGKVNAFLVGDMTYGGVGFISWLGVRPEFRGQGWGKTLVQTYENFVKTRNAHLLELFTFEQVKPFYEKLGFLEVGRRTSGYFGQKNIIMDKRLGEWNDNNLPTLPV